MSGGSTAVIFILLCCLGLVGCCCLERSDEVTAQCYDRMWHPPDQKRVLCSDDTDLVLPDPCVPLDVEVIMDIALQNNPTTQRSWATARAAAYAVDIAKVQYVPSAEANLYHFWQDTQSNRNLNVFEDPDVGFTFGPRNNEAQVLLSYLIMDFGGRCASIRSLNDALLSLNWTHNRAVQTVIVSALRAFYSYLSVEGSFEAQESNVKDAQKSYESAEQLYQAGIRTHVDMLQAKANLLSNQSQLETLRGQMNIALEVLRAAMGLRACTPLTVSKLPETLPIREITDDVCILVEIAKKARPDLSAAYANVMQQRDNLTYNRSQLLPTLNADFLADHITYTRGIVKRSHDYIGTISINVPLSQLLVYNDTINQSRENIYAAEAAYRSTELTVEADVVTSYYNLVTSVEVYRYAEENIKYSKEAYDAMSENYLNGLATIVDLLTSESALAQARSQFVSAKTGWMTSLVNLAYAMGNLGCAADPKQYIPRFEE